jgi:hypothetical protein
MTVSAAVGKTVVAEPGPDSEAVAVGHNIVEAGVAVEVGQILVELGQTLVMAAAAAAAVAVAHMQSVVVY